MIHLLKIEWHKISRYKTFYVLSLLFVLFLILILFGVQRFVDEVATNATTNSAVPIPHMSLYRFPDIWHNLTFLGGYYKTLLGLIFILLVVNDYQYKTIRSNIINGWSRVQFFNAKLLLMTALALITTLLFFLSGTILGFRNTELVTSQIYFSQLYFVAAYFLELFSYLSLVLFLAVWLQRAGLTLIMLIVYTYIIEPVLVFVFNREFDTTIGQYLPLNAIGDIIQVPNSPLMQIFGYEFHEGISLNQCFVALGWALLFIFAVYRRLTRGDL